MDIESESEFYEIGRKRYLMFSISDFRTASSHRSCARLDYQKVIEAMRHLGFSDSPDHSLLGKITRREAQSVIHDFVSTSEENDLTVFFIMSHGTFFNNQLHVQFSCRDAKADHLCYESCCLPLETLIAPIMSCRKLMGRPKLFFFQLCRGNVHASMSTRPDSGIAPPSDNVMDSLGAGFRSSLDRFSYYSSWHGNKSFRDGNGSVFIHYLTETFKEDGLRLDLDDLTKIVNHQMTSHYAKETNLPKGSDLAPEVSHTLTRTLHFNPPNDLVIYTDENDESVLSEDLLTKPQLLKKISVIKNKDPTALTEDDKNVLRCISKSNDVGKVLKRAKKLLESEEGQRALENIEEDSLAEEIPENIRIPRARVQYQTPIQRKPEVIENSPAISSTVNGEMTHFTQVLKETSFGMVTSFHDHNCHCAKCIYLK